MAILCPSNKTNCIIAAITFLFFHLVSVTAMINSNRYNSGFSAHLIRRNSPNSPLHKHKTSRVFRRLLDPNTPGYPLTNGEIGHVLKLSLGTPPSDVYAIADTGSSLVWTQCMPCINCYKTKYGVFDPSKSSTYKNITCYQKECRLLDDQMRSSPNIPRHFCKKYPTRRCPYGLSYADDATSEGFLAKETVTLTSRTGEAITLTDIIFGCGHNNTEQSSPRDEMGVIGLGPSPLSFVYQIAPYVGGNKFSHCLVPLDTDPKIESKINFGKRSEVSGEGVVSTPLIPDKFNYIVMAEGMTIGDEYIPFKPNVTSRRNKIKVGIDSGATYSMLPKYIFDKVTTELKALDPEMKPFIATKKFNYLCFNSTTIPQEPKMSYHFEGGGKVDLVTEKMFIKDDEEDNMLCFGIMHQGDVGDEGVVEQDMGNMLVGFDLDTQVVSLKPTDCLSY